MKTFLERWLIESPNSALARSAYEECSESCLSNLLLQHAFQGDLSGETVSQEI